MVRAQGCRTIARSKVDTCNVYRLYQQIPARCRSAHVSRQEGIT
jgi:hypothetical protein